MRKILIFIVTMAFVYAISWAFCVGIMKLITICFSWPFSLPIATGIWLILCLLKLLFHKSEGGGGR